MNIHTNSIFKFLEACNNVKVQDNTPELCIIIYNMLLHSIPHTSDIVNYLRHCHNNIKAVKYVVWPLSYINVCNFFNVHSSFIIFMLMMDNCYFKKGDMVIRYRTMKKSVTMYSVPYFMSFNIDNYTINHMIFNYYEDTINVNKVRSNKWFIITNGTKNSNSVTITLENRKQVKMLFTQLKQNLFYVMFFIGYAEKFPF